MIHETFWKFKKTFENELTIPMQLQHEKYVMRNTVVNLYNEELRKLLLSFSLKFDIILSQDFPINQDIRNFS